MLPDSGLDPGTEISPTVVLLSSSKQLLPVDAPPPLIHRFSSTLTCQSCLVSLCFVDSIFCNSSAWPFCWKYLSHFSTVLHLYSDTHSPPSLYCLSLSHTHAQITTSSELCFLFLCNKVISPDCHEDVTMKKDNIFVRSFKDGKLWVITNLLKITFALCVK